MVREQRMLEEGIRLEKEGERESAKQKGGMSVVPVENSSPVSIADPEEEIVRLKEHVKCLQGKIREEENTKAKESKHSKRAEREEDLGMTP